MVAAWPGPHAGTLLLSQATYTTARSLILGTSLALIITETA